jgi:hypothetical protein
MTDEGTGGALTGDVVFYSVKLTIRYRTCNSQL